VVAGLREELDALEREAARPPGLVVGVDADGLLADAVCAAAAGRGARFARGSGAPGPERHVQLAAAGAQVIVSLRGRGQGAVGFAVCPVLAVAGDPALFRALRDDFDLDGGAAGGDAIVDRAVATFNGEPTAAERRGARELVLRRLAPSM
jgi:altronate dehydratase